MSRTLGALGRASGDVWGSPVCFQLNHAEITRTSACFVFGWYAGRREKIRGGIFGNFFVRRAALGLGLPPLCRGSSGSGFCGFGGRSRAVLKHAPARCAGAPRPIEVAQRRVGGHAL